MRQTKTKTSGFTLIELLVVVAIIAVLISILLPSLSHARQFARAAAGLSNLRQIGAALYTYAIDNNSTFPLGQWTQAAPEPSYVWYLSINPYMGGQGDNNNDPNLKRPLSKALLDPSAVFNGGECHFSSNCMILPTWDNHGQWGGGSHASLANLQKYNPAYKIASLLPASEVIIITDGVQQIDRTVISGAPKGTAEPVAWWFNNFIWNYGISAGVNTPYSYRDINAKPWQNANKLVRVTDTLENGVGKNPDWQLDMIGSGLTNPWPSIRFRQYDGQGMNALFGDGHAETKQLNNLFNRDFLAMKNW